MNYIKRNPYLRFLMRERGSEYVKVLYGMRGSGKSMIMMDYGVYLTKKGISQDQILIINFRDPSVTRDVEEVYQAIISHLAAIGNKESYLFLDEAQLLPGFEDLVDRLFLHRNVDIYLAGSGDGPLTEKLKKLLPGRIAAKEVFPVSLSEYADGRKIDSERLNEYMTESALPGIHDTPPEHRTLDGVVNSIILHDILPKSVTLRPGVLMRIMKYFAVHMGELISLTQMAKELGRVGRPLLMKSVKHYMECMDGGKLLVWSPLIPLGDETGKKTPSARYAGRFYYKDPIIAELYAPPKSPEKKLFSICGVELARRYHEVATGKTPEGIVDFVTWDKDVRTAWQFIGNEKPEDAEKKIHVLKNLSHEFKKCVLSLNPEKWKQEGILSIHVLDWLIQEKR